MVLEAATEAAVVPQAAAGLAEEVRLVAVATAAAALTAVAVEMEAGSVVEEMEAVSAAEARVAEA